MKINKIGKKRSDIKILNFNLPSTVKFIDYLLPVKMNNPEQVSAAL